MFLKVTAWFKNLFSPKWTTIKVVDGFWVDEQNRPMSYVAYLIQWNDRANELRLKMEGTNPDQHITYVTALKILARANAELYGIFLPNLSDVGHEYGRKLDDLIQSLEGEMNRYVEDENYETADDVKYYLENIKTLVSTPRPKDNASIEITPPSKD